MNYIVGIGGSGARSIEALLYLLAAGLGPDYDINLIFVDPDQNNANWSNTGNVARLYRDLRPLLGDAIDLFRTPITLPGGAQPWSPSAGAANLDAYFDVCNMPPATLFVYHALYSPAQRALNLTLGFHGNPSIGAAIFADAMGRDDLWGGVSNNLQPPGPHRFFEIGSVFGGTGAAGLGAIPRWLYRQGQTAQANVTWGAVLLLPYFTYTPGAGADPSSFSLRAKHALGYYARMADPSFNRVYALGVDSPISQPVTAPGGADQTNRRHVCELLAAAAALHFFGAGPAGQNQCLLISRNDAAQFIWQDVPPVPRDRQNVSVKDHLGRLARTCFAYLKLFYPCLAQIRDGTRSPDTIPWCQDLLVARGVNLKTQGGALDQFKEFAECFLQWIVDSGVQPTGALPVLLARRDAFFDAGGAFNPPASLNEDLFGHLLDPQGNPRPGGWLDPRTLSNVWRRMCNHSPRTAMAGAQKEGCFFRALFEACE